MRGLRQAAAQYFTGSVRLAITAAALALLLPTPPATGASPLDRSFGKRGVAKFSAPDPDTNLGPVDVVRQPDGKLVVLADVFPCIHRPVTPDGPTGCSNSDPPSFVLARFTREGQLDKSFGEGGVVRVIRPELDSTREQRYPEFVDAGGIALVPGGIVVAGAGTRVDVKSTAECQETGRCTEGPYAGMFVARFHDDGRLDTSFGSEGYEWTIEDTDGDGGMDWRQATVNALTIDATGAPLAVGQAECVRPGRDFERCGIAQRFAPGEGPSLTEPIVTSPKYPYEISNTDVGLRRDGVPVSLRTYAKPDFGRRWLDVGPALGVDDPPNIERSSESYVGAEIAVTPANQTVVAGTRERPMGDGGVRVTVFLARYTAGFEVDRTFGKRGIVQTSIAANVTGLARDKSGRLLVLSRDVIPALVRFNANGSLDRSFGRSGQVMSGGVRAPADLIVQPDRKPVLLGDCGERCVALARVKADGGRSR